MAPGGKWHKVLFGVSAAVLVLSAYSALAPARRDNLAAREHRVVLPPPPEVPDPSSVLPDAKLSSYWKDGRMVWVQPVAVKGPVQVELSPPLPTLAVPPMPLPDPSPLLEHARGLPRWGEVPKTSLGEIE